MRNIIVVTHSTMARGVKEAAEFLLGKQDNLNDICAYVDETSSVVDAVKKNLEEHIGMDTVILTDIFGGSVNNESLQFTKQPGVYLIAGVNLPLLLELLMSSEEDTKKVVNEAISAGKENIKLCNDLQAEELDEF